MIKSRFVLVGLGAAGVFAACSPSVPSKGVTEGDLIPACTWPTAADTFNADAGEGCSPRSMFDICEVPSGSTILADGGVLTPDGGVEVCSDACSPTEYELTCNSASPDTGDQIPAPDPSLGCKAIPIPTPSNVLFFCCPCAS
jgi:hypothetical protein